jgi:hypothetical protein
MLFGISFGPSQLICGWQSSLTYIGTLLNLQSKLASIWLNSAPVPCAYLSEGKERINYHNLFAD